MTHPLRSFLQALVATGLLASGMLLSVGTPAWAVAFEGAAPGYVSCGLSLTVKFTPAVTPSGGGTSSKITGSTSDCSTTEAQGTTVVITKGVISTGSISASPITCNTEGQVSASPDPVQTNFTIKWEGTLDGKSARFDVDAIGYPSTTFSFSPEGYASLSLQPSPPTNSDITPGDSFDGPAASPTGNSTAEVTASSSKDTESYLGSLCIPKGKSGHVAGIKSLVLESSTNSFSIQQIPSGGS